MSHILLIQTIAYIVGASIETVAFRRVLPEFIELNQEDSSTSQNIPATTQVTDGPLLTFQEFSGFLNVLTNTDFWLTFATVVFSIAVDKAFFYNVGTYLRSFQIENMGDSLFIGGAILAMCYKVTTGTLVQVSQTKVQRITFMSCQLFIKSLLLGTFTFHGDNFTVLCLTTVTVYFCTAVEGIIAPIITLEYFGVKHYGHIYGSLLFFSSVTSLVLQIILGLMYKQSMDTQNTQYTCYGMKCFYISNIILLVLTVIAFCASLILWYKRRH